MTIEVKELIARAQEKGPWVTVSQTVLNLLHTLDLRVRNMKVAESPKFTPVEHI
jgi:hypothetical protein